MRDSENRFSDEKSSSSQNSGSSRTSSQQHENSRRGAEDDDSDDDSHSRASYSSRSRSVGSQSRSSQGSYSSRSRSRSTGSYSSRSRSKNGDSHDSQSISQGSKGSRATASQASSRGSDHDRRIIGSKSSASQSPSKSSNSAGSSFSGSRSKSSRRSRGSGSSRSSGRRSEGKASMQHSERDSLSFEEETVDEDSKRSQGLRSKRSDASQSKKSLESSGRSSPSFQEETIDEDSRSKSSDSNNSRSYRSGESGSRASKATSERSGQEIGSPHESQRSNAYSQESGSRRSGGGSGSRSSERGSPAGSRRSKSSERSRSDSRSFEEETFDEGSRRSSYSKGSRSHRSGGSSSRSSQSRSSHRSGRDSPSFLDETVNDESTLPEGSRSRSGHSRHSQSDRSRSSGRSGRDSPSFLDETVNDESTFPKESRSKSSVSNSSRSKRGESMRSSQRSSFSDYRSRSSERSGQDDVLSFQAESTFNEDSTFPDESSLRDGSILGDRRPAALEDNCNDDASTFSDESLTDNEGRTKERDVAKDESSDGPQKLEDSFSDASFQSKAQSSARSSQNEKQETPDRTGPKENQQATPVRKIPKENQQVTPVRKSAKEKQRATPVRKSPKKKEQPLVPKSPKEKQAGSPRKSQREKRSRSPRKSPEIKGDHGVKPHTKSQDTGNSKDPFKSSMKGSPERDQTPPTKNKGSATDPETNPENHTGELKVRFEPVVKVQRCKSLAILGTMSDAGKSIITAGLCRVLANKGVRVAPFKGQNMSNNAAPALLPDKERRRKLYKTFQTAVGGHFPPLPTDQPDTGYGEIGTAQSLQAEACRVIPRVEMNPVLLKSGGQNEKGEFMCSVLVLGKQVARETYGDLGKRTTDLRTMVLESHQALAEITECDVVLMEGAGSCTELNLMERDIVNLPLVRSLQCPWLLVANIDCGGVFAQIVGTKMCVSSRDWSLCAGIIVNKLRGETKYFEPGPKMIEEMVGKPVFVVPFLNDLNLPEEDGIGIERRLAWESTGHHHPEANESESAPKPVVVVISYPHTAISDDICPLEADPRFRVEWRRRRLPRPYPHTTAVILPGSRLTRKDLKWLHDSGWAAFIQKHIALGGNVLGLCGGYQMLGWTVDDPDNVEGVEGANKGLGLLPIRTKIAPPEVKVVAPRQGKLYPSGTSVEGFELHCGQSQIVMELGQAWSDELHPLVIFDDGKPEGMCARRVRGTYMHGILWSPKARLELLVPDEANFSGLEELKIQDPLDRLAEHLESCGLDFETLRRIISSHKNQ